MEKKRKQKIGLKSVFLVIVFFILINSESGRDKEREGEYRER